jgi:hypothetical protein
MAIPPIRKDQDDWARENKQEAKVFENLFSRG